MTKKSFTIGTIIIAILIAIGIVFAFAFSRTSIKPAAFERFQFATFVDRAKADGFSEKFGDFTSVQFGEGFRFDEHFQSAKDKGFAGSFSS